MTRKHAPFFFLSSSRKGFELAIGTIVVIILGIVVIVGGIMLLAKVLTVSQAVMRNPTDTERTDLNRQLIRQLTAVTPQTQSIGAGNPAYIAFAVDNRLPADTNFNVAVTGKNASDNDLTFTGASTDWLLTSFPDLTVAQHGVGNGVLILTPGKAVPVGVYTFLLTLTDTSTSQVYDSPRVFTIKVVN